MKILYFHQHFSTPKGATGTRSYEFAKYLISQGHHVTIVCGQYKTADTGLDGYYLRGRREGVVEGIRVVEYELPYSNKDSFIKRSITFLKYSLRSLKEVFTEDYDLLFATSTPLTAAIPGIVMKIFKDKKFVFEVRDLWPELPREMGVITNPVILKLMDWLEYLAYKTADKCIGLSPGICDGITRRGVKRENIYLIPNGCDLALFNSELVSKKIFNDSRIKDDSFVAVFTGAHGIANGLDSAIDAAIKLKEKKIDNIFLVFIGEGREKASLLKRAADQGLNNCIFFNSVSKEKLSQIMNACDVGLMLLKNIPAFYYGTSPNKFFDYLSSGKPVLNNYPGWVADLINEYECGIAVPPESADSFADALIYLSKNPELCKKMGDNARKLAEERFSRSNLAIDFNNALVENA